MEGLYVAAGLNSQGIILGPGVGRALAAWIDGGAPTIDAATLDVRRFAAAQANAGYLFERTRETLGRLYAMHWPFLQPETARGLRRVPLYDRLAAAGACFGESSGWERANWYAPPGTGSGAGSGAAHGHESGTEPGAEPVYRYSWGRQNWFSAVAEEHRAARGAVALFDLSSFAKLRVQGRGAMAWLQTLCTAQLDRPPGAVTYTCLVNGSGGVELDATVTRLGDDSFLLVAPTDTQTKTLHWLTRHSDPSTTAIVDVTSGLGTLAVTGPRSRELLAQLTDAPLDDAAFPFGTGREIEVGWASVLALRVSYVGELGWELYAPVESLAALYDQIVVAGERARPAPRRLPRTRQPARREGLSPLGRRHGAGRHTLRGRPRLYRCPRQAGRLLWAQGAAGGGRRGSAAAARLHRSSTIPSRCSTAASRCSAGAPLRAASRRAPTGTRWARRWGWPSSKRRAAGATRAPRARRVPRTRRVPRAWTGSERSSRRAPSRSISPERGWRPRSVSDRSTTPTACACAVAAGGGDRRLRRRGDRRLSGGDRRLSGGETGD